MSSQEQDDILRREKLQPMPPEVKEFTSSKAFDLPIARHVLDVNKAHVIMLTRKGIIRRKEAAEILKGLKELEPLLENLERSKYEDVHVFIEAELIKSIGEEIGGKIHAGKSRNDQVASALRMELRSNLLELLGQLIQLRKTLIEKAVEHLSTVMVGYTHLQHAQVVTLGHHLLAYHDMFERDTQRLKELYARVNVSPMGSGALATTTLDIDRRLMANLLGFDGLVENSIDAVSSRDFALEALADFSMVAVHLSRLAEELILWSTLEFSFVKIPDAYVSTSSIMPQKRNPEVAELIRARCSHVVGDLNSALTIMKGLPLTYNLDVQEVTPHLWSGYKTTLKSVKLMREMVGKLKFNVERLYEEASRGFPAATEVAEMLVSDCDIPFRTAYRIVGKLVYELASKGKEQSQITAEDLESLAEKHGKKVKVDEGRLRSILDPKINVELKSVIGGPSPKEVKRMCEEMLKRLSVDEEWLNSRLNSLFEASRRLEGFVKELVEVS